MELEWIREHEWHTFSKGKPKFHKQVSHNIASGQGRKIEQSLTNSKDPDREGMF